VKYGITITIIEEQHVFGETFHLKKCLDKIPTGIRAGLESILPQWRASIRSSMGIETGLRRALLIEFGDGVAAPPQTHLIAIFS
nr:hypothetical protein [Tanacetum cinerariifolium]